MNTKTNNKIKKNSNFTRKCIITNLVKPVEELVRFDFNKKNNIITLDINRDKKGRGCYFIPTHENWEKLKKHKGLNRAFRTAVDKEVYNEIEKELEESKCLKKIE
ncbi:YlxR family protein [Mycoplasmopsis caviae]|uniref:Putative transcription termination factor n=1 Tax=Mycoplasmopsis caviae TaxID=55603 RepID=A0A3P8MF80_9BACT|nr:YlxR family protein [Mycoplasmopsis caviae]UUD35328.1 YlxR family protein [Mycoplasmopsis caviae]VDR41893.1 putative transcription termination factor [Mycoplasmopsis caviae]